MIIRNIYGEIIKINKYDYANDKIYYEKIMDIKKEFTKEQIATNPANKTSVFFSLKNNRLKSCTNMKNICDFINVIPFVTENQ
jgi:hypothetical protein